MSRRSPPLVLFVVGTFVAAACGSDTRALPAVARSAVPEAEATVGDRAVVTATDGVCLRSAGQTLVFVDEQAELVSIGSHQRLHVRSTGDDAGLASVPIDGAMAAPIGHPVQPDEWIEQPKPGCDGPYFLVVGFESLGELSGHLLEDADVTGILPHLEAGSAYSTGEDYGITAETELTGPTEDATASVVRQWSRDSGDVDDGQAWTVVSSIFEFASAAEADSAAEDVFDLAELEPTEVGDALIRFTEPDGGLSDGVIVVTRGSLMATVHVSYMGRADPQVTERLAEAATRRLD